MKKFPLQKRTLALIAVLLSIFLLFLYVGLRSGPLAPVAVTVTTVESSALSPALFGIGTVEARYSYKIGPTFAGRLQRLDVQVGDSVQAGQVLGEMAPVDLDDRVRSQDSSIKRAEANLREVQARKQFAQTQAQRYEKLFAQGMVSAEAVSNKRQELAISAAALASIQQELARAGSERDGIVAQRSNLRLLAPVDGIVIARAADPGTTVLAGQAVVELIDPKSLWVNARFDQSSATGLVPGLAAQISLRSRQDQVLQGSLLRLEPKADAVTEELLGKVGFNAIPAVLPPIGELAEVTLGLPALPAAPVILNAAVRREGDKVGVWRLVDGDLEFAPVVLGASDLEGYVQVLEGLQPGDRIVTYSEKPLTAKSNIHVVESLVGAPR